MKVVVDTSAADHAIRLAEVSDFGAFCVEMHGAGGLDDVGRALATQAVGRLAGDHAFVDIEALRRLGPGGADWHAELDRMVDYARSKGWADADGSAIRAHIEAGPGG